MSTSWTRTHMEGFALIREEIKKNSLHLQGRERIRVSKAGPFPKEWEFPWREAFGSSVIVLSLQIPNDCCIKKALAFTSSSQVHRTGSNAWKSQGDRCGDKARAPKLCNLCYKWMLIQRMRRGRCLTQFTFIFTQRCLEGSQLCTHHVNSPGETPDEQFLTWVPPACPTLHSPKGSAISNSHEGTLWASQGHVQKWPWVWSSHCGSDVQKPD